MKNKYIKNKDLKKNTLQITNLIKKRHDKTNYSKLTEILELALK